MTDLDAAAYLWELKMYSIEGRLVTPQNTTGKPDTIWSCACDHAIRALEARAGVEGRVIYTRNPNGSYSAKVR